MATPIEIKMEVELDPLYDTLGHIDTRWLLSLDPLFEQVIYDETYSSGAAPLKELTITVGGEGPIYGRYQLVGENGFTIWSEIKQCAFTDIRPPVITLPAGVTVDNTGLTPTFNVGTYTPISGAGSHVDTSWIITTPEMPLDTKWARVNDPDNLYSVTVPDGILEPGLDYVLMVAHNGQYKNGTFGFLFFNTGL